MTGLNPSLQLLRVLAGEGSFHIYRLLRDRRVFLFTKCLLTTLACFRGRGSETGARSIAFVKGANQLRYYRHAQAQLEAELGALQLYVSAPLPAQSGAFLLPRISGGAVLHQAGFLLLMLLTGKRRYLNLYLLAFASATSKAVATGLRNIESFVCFNDQPYDVAAIVHALHQRQHCRTIVVQHGLILSPNFYFPAVAREFWAWGELSRQHYRAWDTLSRLQIKGRYTEDVNKKQERFVLPSAGQTLRILIAPSFFHDEVRQTLTSLGNVLTEELAGQMSVAIKFHPATKFTKLLKHWCDQHAPWLGEEREPMETLAEKYDVLVTKNSTSAVDFLLRGKPVFFLEPRTDGGFPSQDYGFELKQLRLMLSPSVPAFGDRNIFRQKFLKVALNV